jgi:SAM-dependent methyltransferase
MPAPKRRPKPARPTARKADKHVLYQKAVQAPELEVDFIDREFRRLTGRAPVSFREDFCGTALLSCTWVRKGPGRTATGVDLDPGVLDWGRRHNVAALGDAGSAVRLVCADVRKAPPGRHDVVCAYNYSYWVFKTRGDLRGYFAGVKKGLAPGGLFCLDAYGGWGAQEPLRERRRIPGAGFTYVWEQARFDPITHDVLNHIHFEFADGTKLERAFTYDWRFWSLPELTELLAEAGFGEVTVHWDTSHDEARELYRPRTKAENQPGWLAYIVARAG